MKGTHETAACSILLPALLEVSETDQWQRMAPYKCTVRAFLLASPKYPTKTSYRITRYRHICRWGHRSPELQSFALSLVGSPVTALAVLKDQVEHGPHADTQAKNLLNCNTRALDSVCTASDLRPARGDSNASRMRLRTPLTAPPRWAAERISRPLYRDIREQLNIADQKSPG